LAEELLVTLEAGVEGERIPIQFPSSARRISGETVGSGLRRGKSYRVAKGKDREFAIAVQEADFEPA
jgi:hypothetical protein